MDAEAPAPGVPREKGKLRMAQTNQCRVIAALQVDFRLRLNAGVDNDVEPIALARRWDSAGSAILEQLFKFMFRRQLDGESKPQREIGEADVMRCGYDCEDITIAVAKNHRFGQSIARDPTRLGAAS